MSAPVTHSFRLYIAGDGPNSVLATQNLRAVCQEHLSGQHEIEVVDLVQQPRRALEDRVLLTPTLICHLPGAEHRIVGNLSDRRQLLRMLGLEGAPDT